MIHHSEKPLPGNQAGRSPPAVDLPRPQDYGASPNILILRSLRSIQEATVPGQTWTPERLLSLPFDAMHHHLVAASSHPNTGTLGYWVQHDLSQIFSTLKLLADNTKDAPIPKCVNEHIGCAKLLQTLDLLHHVSSRLIEVVQAEGTCTIAPSSVSAVIDSAIRHVQYAAGRAGIQLKHQRRDITGVCAPFVLEQVVSNLMWNSIEALTKSATPSPQIDVAYHHHADRLHVSVSDNGPGISQRDRRRIFRAGYSTKDHVAGHGLGLMICSQLVKSQGGSISAQDPRTPAGARFEFDIAFSV